MQLLIVNPNTSEGVTQNINDAAQSVLCEGDCFTTVSAAFGPELIVSDQDGLDAVAGVMASVRAHANVVDGIILGSFGDTGTEAVRLAYPEIPVIGIANAAFAAARCLGGKFSIVTFDESLSPALYDRAAYYGMGEQLHRILAVRDSATFDAAHVQVTRFEAMNALCADCAHDPINSIILGGGPLAGLSSKLTPVSGIPIIDGTQAAVGLIRSMVGE